MADTIIFYVHYAASGVSKTGLTDVTADVYSVNRSSAAVATIATAAACTEIGSGFYMYRYASAAIATYDYLCTFKSADATVDAKQQPSGWMEFVPAHLTELANLDAAVSTRLATTGYTAPPTAAANADAVWDEATSGHSAAGSTGLQLTTIDTDVWGYATRTLTQTAAQVAAAVSGSVLTITRYITFDATLSGLTLTGTKLIFSIKQNVSDTDNDAMVTITAADGLTRIMGAAAVTAANGSITVSSTDLIIHLDEAETLKLPVGNYIYSVKRITATDSIQVTNGSVVVADEAIKAIA